MAGKLIVLEGTDGSGKSTQFSLLCQGLERAQKPFERIVFPQYSEASSALVTMYLQGEFGAKPSDVSPYAASAFYAVDRFASLKKVWGAGYDAGGLVVSDRYTTANAVHQTGKLPEAEWPAFLEWLFDFEYQKLGLPKPDLVLFLDMPTEKATELLRQREGATNTSADIHERDTQYLARCRSAANTAAALYGWQKISCVDGGGTVKPIAQLQAEIWDAVAGLLL